MHGRPHGQWWLCVFQFFHVMPTGIRSWSDVWRGLAACLPCQHVSQSCIPTMLGLMLQAMCPAWHVDKAAIALHAEEAPRRSAILVVNSRMRMGLVSQAIVHASSS